MPLLVKEDLAIGHAHEHVRISHGVVFLGLLFVHLLVGLSGLSEAVT